MARTGRPKGTNNKEVNYTLRLDEETNKRLLMYCEAFGLTRSEALREAIDGMELQEPAVQSEEFEAEKQEIVVFKNGDLVIDVPIDYDQETVWLSSNQMAILFGRDEKTIRKHVNNILADGEVSAENNTQKMRVDGVKQLVSYYSLDVILSVGYRVNSQKGIEFRRWANSVLKQYLIKGYALNEKRLEALQKTVEIQTRMLADTLNIEERDILFAVQQYTDALVLLDQYDHQSLKKPTGTSPVYKITYDDCRRMIDMMEDSFQSDVFGVEKEPGKLEGILAAVYQDVFGGEVYPSLEEKAANLLYFMIKDHPFADGCKRIAASLFLEFLSRNKMLFKENEKRISDGALVAITLMIAESRPDEKDIMVSLVMNILNM